MGPLFRSAVPRGLAPEGGHTGPRLAGLRLAEGALYVFSGSAVRESCRPTSKQVCAGMINGRKLKLITWSESN